jgi:hypothetical protein
MKRDGPSGTALEHSIGKQRMKMNIQVQSAAKALHERDRTGPSVRASIPARAVPLPREDGAEKDLEHWPKERGAIGDEQPNVPR